VRAEARRSLPLAGLFVLGLAAGTWTFVAPWAVGYPVAGGWTGSVWTSVWAGAAEIAASAAGLVAILAHALHAATRRPPDATGTAKV